jgi:hypothetical protein
MTLDHFLNLRLNGLESWFVPLLLASVVLVALLAWQMRTLACLILTLPRKSALRQKAVLTDNETEFYTRLKRALPDFEIWPQVGMGALLEPLVKESNPEFWRLRQQFQSKICDYVIAKAGAPRGTGVVAVIELDDKTHDAHKDAIRDAMLASAGIKTIRWESRNKPTESQIRSRILALG